MDLNTIIYYGIGLALLYILGLILLWPLKKILKLIGNGILGGLGLLLFNLIGKNFGLTIVINPLSAITVGFLGIPGVILLLVLQAIL